MKNKTIISIAFSVIMLFIFSGFTTDKNVKEITIKTSTVCEMCKERIEKNLIFEKGVKEVKVDLAKKEVHVKFRSDKTSPEKIKAALSKLGYRADEIAADPEGFRKLPACCKTEGCGKD